ncbi:DUF4179 domain-containing protein [Metaclostridioides mangenotii]|uniref:DUF4179 domain-containing protein n=1 Tax=Metaclostridioides mangenotii TaxID=1540 RepID=UPI0028E62256|nr:DUF4179 domain-containing protein [Clostridioides mangenotii]
MNEYKEFNNVKFDIDSYEEVNVNKELIKSTVKSKLNKVNNKYKKVLVASISVLVIAGGLFTFRQPVYANIYKVMYDIKNALGLEFNLDEYKTVVGKSISKNGLTITLNEVILDEDELIVSTTYKYDKELKHEYISCDPVIYVNGKSTMLSGYGNAIATDKKTTERVITYRLEESLKSDIDIKLVYLNPTYFENNKEKVIKGRWQFNFKISSDELAIDTKTMDLNESFDLGEDETMTLKKYRTNILGTKIIYNRKIHNDEYIFYDIKLVGKDDLGNDVEFYFKSTNDKEGKLILNKLDKNLNEKATKLTLTPYAAKQANTGDKMNSNFKQIGEEFVIDLNKLK